MSFISVTNAEVYALEPLSYEISVSFDPPGEKGVPVVFPALKGDFQFLLASYLIF